MENESRGERRRRIVERESDRMALITGRIRTLPPSPPPSPASPSPMSFTSYRHRRPYSDSSLSFFSSDHHSSPPPVSEANNDTSDSTLLKHETCDEVSRGDNSSIDCATEHHLNKYDYVTKTMANVNPSTNIQSSSATLTVLKQSINREPASSKRHSSKPRFFTSRRMNSCIIGSQSTRVFCSLIIGFLVVLSYADYPLFARNLVKSESVIASRPLYILLLTDVTIVLGRMFLERRRDAEEAEEETEEAPEDGRNWRAAVKVLERGLVVYQAFRGVFIDASVYAVVVICGLSLV